jgi:hypothetical protein
MIAHACNSSTQEAKVGGLCVQSQSGFATQQDPV